MKSFDNLSLRAKLLSGFGLVTGLLVLTGTLTIWSLRTLGSADTALYEDETVRLGLVGEWNVTLEGYRVVLRDLALAEDSAQRAAYSQELTALSERASAFQDQYEATLSTDRDRALFGDLLEARQAYLAPAREVADLVRQERREEAIALMLGEAGRTGDVYSAALDAIAEARLEGAKQMAEANTALYLRIRAIMIGILVLGILIAAGIALFISGWVTRRIQLVVERVQALQQRDITNLGAGAAAIVRGDLENRVDYGTEPLELDLTEEIGSLARAVDGIIESTGGTARRFEEAQQVLKRVVGEARELVKAAGNGDLSKRADGTGIEGAYGEMVAGLNGLLEAVVTPLE